MRQELIDSNTYQNLENLNDALYRAEQLTSLSEYAQLFAYVRHVLRRPINRYHELIHIHADKIINGRML